MHVTLHITTGCNMRCDYCYSPPKERTDMTEETARKAIDFAAALNPENTGVIFFGGEPLLHKDLIYSTIAYCQQLEKEKGYTFHYKMTTNGLLLDAEFLKFAADTGLNIVLSFDGIKQAHDTHRKTAGHEGTFDVVKTKLPLLLSFQRYATVIMVVNPKTVKYYADSVEFLFKSGLRYLIASLNYAGGWTDADFRELKKQYRKIASIYEKMTLEQKKFYFSPFETKFSSHIKGKDAKCEQCHLAQKQVSVAYNGDIYPCVQFVKDGVSSKQFRIGHVDTGIDEARRAELYAMSWDFQEPCTECALKERCFNTCSCLNWQTTGELNQISPVLCEHERMIIPIVDKLGERLFRKKAPMFIQKHYNAAYPVLSLLDDMEEEGKSFAELFEH